MTQEFEELTMEQRLKDMLISESAVLLKWIGDAQKSYDKIQSVVKDEKATEDVLTSGLIITRLYIQGLVAANNSCMDIGSIEQHKPLEDLFVYHAMMLAKQIKKQEGKPRQQLILPN